MRSFLRCIDDRPSIRGRGSIRWDSFDDRDHTDTGDQDHTLIIRTRMGLFTMITSTQCTSTRTVTAARITMRTAMSTMIRLECRAPHARTVAGRFRSPDFAGRSAPLCADLPRRDRVAPRGSRLSFRRQRAGLRACRVQHAGIKSARTQRIWPQSNNPATKADSDQHRTMAVSKSSYSDTRNNACIPWRFQPPLGQVFQSKPTTSSQTLRHCCCSLRDQAQIPSEHAHVRIVPRSESLERHAQETRGLSRTL